MTSTSRNARLAGLLFPALFGEIAIILWLLIVGAKQRPLTAPAS